MMNHKLPTHCANCGAKLSDISIRAMQAHCAACRHARQGAPVVTSKPLTWRDWLPLALVIALMAWGFLSCAKDSIVTTAEVLGFHQEQ